jgi:hypothetical protein
MIMKMSSACNSSICIWFGTDHLTCRGEGLWGFFFVQKYFFGQHESSNIFFFVAHSAKFFPVFNIRIYDKNSESDYFFIPPPKSEKNFSNIGNQNIFLEKRTSVLGFKFTKCFDL